MLPCVQVACGLNHTLALSVDGMTVWAFGDGDYGKLGTGSNAAEMRPVAIDKLSNVGIKKICAGTQFSLALTKSGVVYSWGQGMRFQVFSIHIFHVCVKISATFFLYLRSVDWAQRVH